MIKNQVFEIEAHRMTGGIERLVRIGDKDYFNWTQGRFGIPYGINFLDNIKIEDNIIKQKYSYFTYLDVNVERRLTDEGLREKYEFINCGEKPLEFEMGELGIYATFADSVDIEDTLIRRARSHIWCGQNSSYIYNARLDGKTDGVGLALLEGSFVDYEEEGANDYSRGDIALKLPHIKLAAGETYNVEWLVFSYSSKDEFINILQKNNILVIDVNNYYPSLGEEIVINAKADKAIYHEKEYDFVDGVAKIAIEHEGEQNITLIYGSKRTNISVYSGSAEQNIFNYISANNKKKLLFNKNWAEPLCSAIKNVDLYKKVEDEGYLALAAIDLFRYYGKYKGEKRADIGIPIILLKNNEELLKRFKKQLINALSHNGRYSLYREISTIDMLLSAYQIWGEEGYRIALNYRIKRIKNWLGVQPNYKYFNRAYLDKNKYIDALDYVSAFSISGKEQSLREYLTQI